MTFVAKQPTGLVDVVERSRSRCRRLEYRRYIEANNVAVGLIRSKRSSGAALPQEAARKHSHQPRSSIYHPDSSADPEEVVERTVGHVVNMQVETDQYYHRKHEVGHQESFVAILAEDIGGREDEERHGGEGLRSS